MELPGNVYWEAGNNVNSNKDTGNVHWEAGNVNSNKDTGNVNWDCGDVNPNSGSNEGYSNHKPGLLPSPDKVSLLLQPVKSFNLKLPVSSDSDGALALTVTGQ